MSAERRTRSAEWVWLRGAVLLVAILTQTEGAFAHNPDTSYARLFIARERVFLKLTYDVTSLVRIIPALDADDDHRLTRGELDAAAPKIAAFLLRTIEIEIDGTKTALGAPQPVAWPPDAGDAIAEKDYHAATSLIAFTFDLPTEQPPVDVWIRFDFFETLGLRHTVLGAIAHEGKEDEVLFTPFEPDYLYETTYPPPPKPTATPTVAGGAATTATEPAKTEHAQRRSSDDTLAGRFWQFFVLGVEHIIIGYDHILFLLSLIVVSRFGELVKIITSFTIAHSITLALATLGWVQIPSNIVETAIAATIVFTAVENFWIKDTSGRWKLTFFFGLIHGFGFAGVLKELSLPTEGFVRTLLAFNLGVEAGQLAIVAALALPIAAIKWTRYGRKFQLAASATIALCGLGWFLDRAFGLEWMPF